MKSNRPALSPLDDHRSPGIVAVPVHNEASHIAALLDSLAAQQPTSLFAVLLLLNNCTDNTAGIVGEMADALPFRVHLSEHLLPVEMASAGIARQMAMAEAALLTGPDGVLLTTDADARVPSNWIVANLAALGQGADAVAGCAVIDPIDEASLPRRMIQDEARVQLLTTLLDEIDHLLDPAPVDPWPRHTQHSGASIAVRKDAFLRVGGIPAIPSGEDRAFFHALARQDFKIRHAPEVAVTVSGRLFGRASGGMAATMRRRISQPDTWLDDPVEAADSRFRRATLRAAFRRIRNGTSTSAMTGRLLKQLNVDGAVLEAGLQNAAFGQAWYDLEQASSNLRRQCVPYLDCELQIRRALELLRSVRRSNVANTALAEFVDASSAS